ncbi:hypothetical protein HNR46_004298 [Haloferula luteola]|uniref:Uncharacterized protein n=1 Tax=Haloferula luteola TaxID=595692 RepID=A0A840VAB1_9BACT|nr:hypothetical protein [Haloferula luteola]MBB5354026.1 hypothetical protein [Haloferula luteola]
MDKHGAVPEYRRAGSFRYAWPAPLGLTLILTGYGVAEFLGHRAFLKTHAVIEFGIVVSLLASVVYAIRLAGKGRVLAPRWVFLLNLCFGPLIFGFLIVSGLTSILTGNY